MTFRIPIFLLLIGLTGTAIGQNLLKVMTFNIRYNNPGDGVNAWPNRLDLVNRLLAYHEPDIIGVQEALEGQMNDLKEILPGFDSEGIARTEGGEYSAILYRAETVEKLAGNTFYLSPTPDQLSTGWDAALPRIATWARFRLRATGAEFFCINTHFDHRGVQARKESASLIISMIDSLNVNDLPIILTGDFNATPESEPIQTILSTLNDSRQQSHAPAHGPDGTWTGWTIAGEPGRTIDYVFVQGDLTVSKQAHLAESFSGRFPSDHLPVLAEIMLYPPKATLWLHSHNDYETDRPLFEALEAGATSIEVDVWLVDGTLRASHLRPLSPEHSPTLEQLYLQPLASWVAEHGGEIYPGYGKKVQFMIDVKHDAAASLAALTEACRPYRGLPIEFIISGNRDIHGILSEPDQLFSIDGRLGDIENTSQMTRTPMISMPFRDFSSWKGRGEMPLADEQKITEAATSVHEAGATFRLWGIPQNEKVWENLKELGVDWINADELSRGMEFLRSGNQD